MLHIIYLIEVFIRMLLSESVNIYMYFINLSMMFVYGRDDICLVKYNSLTKEAF